MTGRKSSVLGAVLLIAAFSRIANSSAVNRGEALPPAEDRIAFYSSRSGNAQLYVMNAGGSDARRLTDDPKFDGAPSWGVVEANGGAAARESAETPSRAGRTSGGGEAPLTLTYVANMGVLVCSGEIKVLVDALFDKPNPEYRAPAPETLDQIMKGAAPFDGVDVVLVTHNHPDHFDAGLAVRYLESGDAPVLVAPEDAVGAMRRAAADWSRIEPRVISIDLKVGETRRLSVGNVPVTACRTLHSGDRDDPANLMYLFEIGGRSVWHEGDPNGRCEIFQAFGLKDTPLDLAVVHYWYPLEPNCARFLQEDLRAGHIALGHLPIRLEGDAPGKIDMVRHHYKDIFLLLPGAPAKVMDELTGRQTDSRGADRPARSRQSGRAMIFRKEAERP
jgi:L-ascorbate metabolism protein UlaG (beta-lactamase superfamily)